MAKSGGGGGGSGGLTWVVSVGPPLVLPPFTPVHGGGRGARIGGGVAAAGPGRAANGCARDEERGLAGGGGGGGGIVPCGWGRRRAQLHPREGAWRLSPRGLGGGGKLRGTGCKDSGWAGRGPAAAFEELKGLWQPQQQQEGAEEGCCPGLFNNSSASGSGKPPRGRRPVGTRFPRLINNSPAGLLLGLEFRVGSLP